MGRKSKQDSLREAASNLAESGMSCEDTDLGAVKGWLSTGCTLLDLAIANKLPGGFPSGRVSHIFGAESTAKTILAMEPLGSAQRQGGIADFQDAEGTFDAERAKLLHGIDLSPEKWHYYNPETIEDLWDVQIPAAIERSTELPIAAMAVDSLTAIAAAAEITDKSGDAVSLSGTGYAMQRAKQLSSAFRHYRYLLNTVNLGLIFVDQARDAVGSFRPTEKTSSGRAILFYSSVRVHLKTAGWITNTKKITTGVKIKFTVEKNKVAPPYRKGEFYLYFDYGIDDVESNLRWLKDIVGGDYVIGDYSSGRIDLAVKHVEENGLEGMLRDTVHAVWKELYKPVERKARVRFDGNTESTTGSEEDVPVNDTASS